MLSITQAAKRLNVSRQRVHQLLKAGRLGGVRVGETWVVDEASVEDRIKAKK